MRKNINWLFTAAAAVLSFLVVSCYRITLVVQDHEVRAGEAFSGKVVVKRSGDSSNGVVQDVHGLFGICVPEGWTAEGNMVMTQVPKEGTNVGDDEYKSTITRILTPNEKYTKLLNGKFPKRGYTWLGFATMENFKSLFNADDESHEVDSIYVKFRIRTTMKSGTFYLDYVAGQCGSGKLDRIGEEDVDWSLKTGTFSDDAIGCPVTADTHIDVLNADGSLDSNADTPLLDSSWNLVPLENSTRLGNGVHAYKDKLYDSLFTRTRGWNGGDGVFTVGLPDGNVFWTFNDSFYGKVNASNRARTNCNFPRNSIMMQKAENGKPGTKAEDLVWLADYVNWTDSTADRYFQARTHLRHPLATKSAADIKKGDIDQDYLYWSGDGMVCGDELQMLWFGVDNRDGRMVNISTAVATYSLSGSQPTGYYLPDIPDYLPKDGNYLYMKDVKHNINTNRVSYGSTLFEDSDGHNYLYAQQNYTPVVARTATRSLLSPWEYYVRDSLSGTWSWVSETPDSATISRSSIMQAGEGLNLPWVIRDGDWYYLISQGPFFSKKVYIFRSKTPYGPFGEKRELFTLPSELDKLGTRTFRFTYMVNLHQELSRDGELVITTNTDTDSFWDNFNAEGSADFYRPYFYRVYNWKAVYDDQPLQTDIGKVHSSNIDTGTFCNLQGMRVLKPTRGVYIHNGHKVMLK